MLVNIDRIEQVTVDNHEPHLWLTGSEFPDIKIRGTLDELEEKIRRARADRISLRLEETEC
jgi:hypothetical protein